MTTWNREHSSPPSFRRQLYFLTAGCDSKTLEVAPPAPPAIPVSQPVERQVTDYVDFTGRIEAPEAVSVVPRVTGYLMSTPFKEGAEVKKDDVLFQIDPRPYQAQLRSGQWAGVAERSAREGSNGRQRTGQGTVQNARRDQQARYGSLSGRRGRSRWPRCKRPRPVWKCTS